MPWIASCIEDEGKREKEEEDILKASTCRSSGNIHPPIIPRIG